MGQSKKPELSLSFLKNSFFLSHSSTFQLQKDLKIDVKYNFQKGTNYQYTLSKVFANQSIQDFKFKLGFSENLNDESKNLVSWNCTKKLNPFFKVHLNNNLLLRARSNNLNFGVKFHMKKFDFFRNVGVYLDFVKKPNISNLVLNNQLFYTIKMGALGFLKFDWRFQNFDLFDSKFSLVYENKSKPVLNNLKRRGKEATPTDPQNDQENQIIESSLQNQASGQGARSPSQDLSAFDQWFNRYWSLLLDLFYFKVKMDVETKKSTLNYQMEALLPISRSLHITSQLDSKGKMKNKLRVDVSENLSVYYGVNLDWNEFKGYGTGGLVQTLFEQKLFNFAINYDF